MAEISIKIFRQEAKFVYGAASISQLPKLFLPQFAFVGKSNVGKSSLINKICNRKSLARVSHTPGRTQQINFFSIAEKFLLVDLPGYGYAKVSEKQKTAWEKLIVHYLQTSDKLIIVNLLVDARRGIKDNDIEVMNLLKSAGKNFQIIFTKTDKISNIDQFILSAKESMNLLGFDSAIIATSSRSGQGTKELQASILNNRILV